MKLATPPVHDIPPMAAPVTVVGDVHLCPEQPDVVSHFVKYLARVASRGGTLVILGDLFDYWYGPPQADEPFARMILDQLGHARDQGLALAFLPGNRDFLLGHGGELDFDVWPDPVRTTWDDKRVLLTHGDLLCTADRSYQRMRRALRRADGRPRGWLGLFPWAVHRFVAVGLRNVSERATKGKPMAWMDIDYGAARTWLDRFEADVMVAGHVHTGVHHRLPGENGADARDVYVLKDWERGGGVVLFDQGGVRLMAPERD